MPSQTFRIISPVDGSVYAERELAATAEVLAAVDRAATAQRDWQRRPLEQRVKLLADAVARLERETDAVAEELSWQIGRPLQQGGGEVRGFADRARYMLDIAAQALADVDPGLKPGFRRYIRREPLGVVFTVAPWNFPYMTAVNSIWPALAAGNTVLLKHSRQTALCGERLLRILTEAGLPDGVFQCLHMSHDSANEAMQHPAVRLICFTGSVAGGRSVQRAIAGSAGFPGANLELGGKDPAYVRADADIAFAAAGIADGALFNAGQSCCAVERVYVHEALYEAFVEALVAEIHSLKLGNPLHANTSLGPMVSAAAADFVRGQIRDAVAAGARGLIDSRRFADDGGAYLAPQLLVDVDHSMGIMNEESFGPVMGLMRVSSDEEALALMNDSDFGLSASLWTQDLDAAERLGQHLDTGTVFMNRSDYLDPALAWTGVKHTGRGCSLSSLGYEQLTRPKSFHLRHAV